jgi:DNA-binding CsgD family transcriptional regulator
LPPRSQIVDLDRFGLTPKQREVAELRYNYGLKTAYAIGKHLGKDPKTVADHLSAIDTRVSWQRDVGGGEEGSQFGGVRVATGAVAAWLQ